MGCNSTPHCILWLDLYNSGSDIDDFSSHWCPEADHPPSQDLRSVLMMIFPLQRGWI
ncbi:unnamed protein product, partial [Vitis vinifera]